MLVFLLFLFGLAVGSFLNVLIDRIPDDKSPLREDPTAINAEKALEWEELTCF